MRDSFFLPLLGGGRSQNIEILSVTPPDGFGTADIIGDLFRFKAGPVLEAQPIGVPIPFPVSVSYLDGDGKTVDTVVFITSTNGPTGARLTLPGGQIADDTALISPIPVDAQFNDPFTFATPPLTQPIIVDESIFVDIFNAQNPQFLEAFITTQAAFIDASVVRTEAVAETQQAAEALGFLTETAEARALATAQRTIADTQSQVLASLQQELADALEAFSQALLAQANAQQAFEAANAQLTVLSSQLNVLETALLPAALVELAEANLAITIQLGAFGLPAPVEQHLDDPVFGPLLTGLVQIRDDRQSTLTSVQDQIAELQGFVEDAIVAQTGAIAALGQASIALAEAQERIEEFEGVDFDALEESVGALEAQAGVAELVAGQLEDVAEAQFGVDVPVSQNTLDTFALAFAEAVQNQALADVAVAEAQAAFDFAALTYQAQLDALPDFEFTFAAFQAGFGFDANLGFEFHFNQATEETPREFVTTLLYDFGIEVDLNSVLVVPDVFLGIDVETPIEIDFEFERSGRIQLGGRDRPERPERGERFERLDAEDRFAEWGSGDRLGSWADSFDFL